MDERRPPRARAYVDSHDFTNRNVLQKAFADGLDQRVLMYGGFFQIVGRLINLGVLDRDLFAAIPTIAPQVWNALRPVAYEMRARDNPMRWIDLEYLVYSTKGFPLKLSRYPAEFLAMVQPEPQISKWLSARETR